MKDDKFRKLNQAIRKTKYSTLRLKRITNLVIEGFTWVQAKEIRNNEERSPNHVKC